MRSVAFAVVSVSLNLVGICVCADVIRRLCGWTLTESASRLVCVSNGCPEKRSGVYVSAVFVSCEL